MFSKKTKGIAVTKYKCLSFSMENKRKSELCFVKVTETLNSTRAGYSDSLIFKE